MKEIHVVGAAIMDGSKVLAAQRSKKMKSPLKWEFVGGKVEKGETHKSALEREVQEELGIRIEVKDFVAEGSSLIEDKRIILYVYKASILEGIPKVREHLQLRWVDIEDIEQLDFAEADLPACQKLLSEKAH